MSSLLYLSLFFSFAFLLPVQIAYGRLGKRAGLATGGISAIGIAATQVIRLALAGSLDLLGIAAGILPPCILLGALMLMNASFGRGIRPVYRAFAAAALCSLAALPLIIALERDASIISYLEKQIGALLAPLKSAIGGDGYEASALAASLDPREIVATGIATLRDSYAAILFVLIGGSWRIGSRLAGENSLGHAEVVAIDELKLPFPFIWAFLASWFLVLGAVLLHGPETVSAVAWNCGLALAVAYAAQGLGILTYLFKSWKMPRSLRIMLVILAIVAMVTPTTAIVVAVALPLFGVTEIWIPYRKPKGVGA
jgi:hypothetical protein